jgi:hypothetical protein
MPVTAAENPSYFTTARGARQPPPQPAIAPRPSDIIAPLPTAPPATHGGAPSGATTVLLRDPRLRTHLKAVLDHWEELTVDEQTVVLALAKLLDERRQGR